MPNKVKYNLKNVHYALLTSGATAATPTYGTPVAIPGAVSLSLDANGEPENFYADGIAYYVINNNMGYDGDLEIALIPESFRTDVLHETLDNNGVLVEDSNSELAPFALLFEFDGDQKHIRHVLYNCSASRPAINGKTNEEAKEVQTETIVIKATPLSNGFVKAKTGNTTGTTAYNGWYSAVYLPDTTFGVTPTTLSIEQGDSETATLQNALGTVTAEVKKGSTATADVTATIDSNTVTVAAIASATTGSYTVTLTDGGRASSNTATIAVTVTSA